MADIRIKSLGADRAVLWMKILRFLFGQSVARTTSTVVSHADHPPPLDRYLAGRIQEARSAYRLEELRALTRDGSGYVREAAITRCVASQRGAGTVSDIARGLVQSGEVDAKRAPADTFDGRRDQGISVLNRPLPKRIADTNDDLAMFSSN